MPEQDIDPVEQSRMTFGEHLDELRMRLIRALLVFFVAFVGCYIYSDDLVKLVCEPLFWILKDNGFPATLFPRRVTEVFFTTLKMSAIAGLVISSPWIMFQLWAFVAAGLYPSERRVVYSYAPLSMVCFLVGAVFFYLLVLPLALNYFVSFGKNVEFSPSAGKPWNIRMLYPDDPSAEALPAAPIEVKAVDAAGKEIVLRLTPGQVKTVIPTLESDPDPKDLRVGQMWINTLAQELRVAVRETEVDDNAWYDKALNKAFDKDLKPARHEWVIRTIPFQAKAFLAQAFTLDDYVSFVSMMALIFGLAFQVPLVVLFVIKIGFTERKTLAGIRKYILFTVVCLAAVISPTPDPFTQLMLAGPMYLLYELGLLLSLFMAAPLTAEERAGDFDDEEPASKPAPPREKHKEEPKEEPKREPEPEDHRSIDDD